jgi:basic membrane protein A and related proteins
MRMQRRYAGVAMLLSATLVLSSCGGLFGKGLCRDVGSATGVPPSPPPSTGGSSDAKIGLVTDVGTLDDKSFNEYSWVGAQQGAEAIGAPAPQNIITTNSADYAANIQSFVDQDYDVIVTVGFAIGAATWEAAANNPDIHFVGVDQFQEVDTEDEATYNDTEPENYESLIFNEAQAGYLAGIVAATITKSGEIAAIGGSGDIPPVVNYMRGYENAAHTVKSDIVVHLKYVNHDDLSVAFNDPAAGKSFADQFRSQNSNTDVIFQVAGKTGNGVIQSAAEGGLYAIGVDVDQWQSVHDQANCIVTSAEKHLSRAVSDAIIAFGQGEPRTSNVFYGAFNDGIGLAPFYQFADLITADTQARIDDAYAAMALPDDDPDYLDPCLDSGGTNTCYAGERDTGN